MPIAPELRHFYGREWRTVTRPRILARAANRCERCQKPNGAWIHTVTEAMGPASNRLYFMWWKLPSVLPSHWVVEYQCCYAPGDAWLNHAGKVCYSAQLPPGPRLVRVVLTVAHLNHTAGDDRDENLAALCQWCHLTHDRRHHAQSRGTRKDQGRPLFASSDRITIEERP
jgi:hypothetical protein